MAVSGRAPVSASAAATSGTASGQASSRHASASSTYGAPVRRTRSSFAPRPVAAQVPPVELAEEPDGALLPHLPHHLAHEPDELGDHLVALRLLRCGRRAISRSAHGRPWAPRPTMTAAAPVSASTRSADGRSTMSPEAITGTATRLDQLRGQRVVGEPGVHLLGRAGVERQRGDAQIARAAAEIERGPRAVPQPRRIFTVTGTSTASTTAPASRQARS